MNESIYNLIPDPYVEAEKSPRHTSKFKNSSVRLPVPSYTTFPTKDPVDGTAANLFRRSGANMGKVVGPEIDPRRFLTKGNGTKFAVAPVQKEKFYTKPPIVVAEDKPVMGLHSEKDFVRSNAVEIANMATKGRKAEAARPTDRTSFGKVPKYLESVKNELNGERQYQNAIRESEEKRMVEAKQQFVHQMSEEQRQQLLAQLKQRWEEKHRLFLSIPFARDTMMQIARKEAIEQDLKELETALARLEKKVVYIYKDDPMYGSWAKATATQEAQLASTRTQ
jgi:hypothetical protein